MEKKSRKCQVEELAQRTPESLAKSLIEAREKVEKLEGQLFDLRLQESRAHGKAEKAKEEAEEAKEKADCLSRVNKAMAKVLRKNGIAPMKLIIRSVVKTCPSSCPENRGGGDCEIRYWRSLDDEPGAVTEDDKGEENCPEKKLAEETRTAEFYCFFVCDGELEGIDEDFDDIFEDGVFQVIDKETMKTIYGVGVEDDLEEENEEEEQADD